MEEEIKKGNTDCVYFLASPLTCKKGSECEYRHCESARLNPRDCWYWFNGNCLNPSCSFRHPPMEGLAEASSRNPAVSFGKVNAPCYFYFNSFCAKGDKCHFLHEHVMYPPQKASTAREIRAAIQTQEKDTFAASNAGRPSSEPQQTLKKSAREPIGETHFENTTGANSSENSEPVKTGISSESTTPSCDKSPGRSPGRDASSGEDASVGEHITALANSTPDQSVDGLKEYQVCSDEHWESSQGFDVLVDHDPKELIYEHDSDSHHVLKEDLDKLPSHLEEYNYEEFDGHDHFGYPDTRCLPDQMHYGSSYRVFGWEYDEDIDMVCGSSSNYFSDHSSKRVSRHRSSRQQRVFREHGTERRDRLGFHQCSRKQRRVDDLHASSSNWKNHFDQFRDHGREQTRRVTEISDASFSLDLRRNVIDPYLGRKRTGRSTNHRGSLIEYKDHNRLTSSRQSQRESRFSRRRENLTRRHAHSLQYSESLGDNKKNMRRTSVDFPAPKTLAQIKDEKKKADKNKLLDSRAQYPRRKICADFEGPKSLKELLKRKETLDPNGKRSHRSALSLEESRAGDGGGNNDRFSRGYKRNFSDEGYSDDSDYNDDRKFARRHGFLNS